MIDGNFLIPTMFRQEEQLLTGEAFQIGEAFRAGETTLTVETIRQVLKYKTRENITDAEAAWNEEWPLPPLWVDRQLRGYEAGKHER